MVALQWSDTLALGLPAMDATHQEFVALLARVVEAPDAELLPLWHELVEHTDAHFAREDGWMQQTGFAATNCHSSQHQIVLHIMREGDKRGRLGDLAMVRQMADELGVWFPQHAHSMDAGLALHLRHVGFDTQTGSISLPQALPAQAIEGCHGADCATGEVREESLATA